MVLDIVTFIKDTKNGLTINLKDFHKGLAVCKTRVLVSAKDLQLKAISKTSVLENSARLE